MEIIRYINGEKICGDMPHIRVDNPCMIQIVKDLKGRLISQGGGQIKKCQHQGFDFSEIN